MNRKINFLSILILLSFSIIFSVAIHAQNKFRVPRPVETDSSNPSAADSADPFGPNTNSSDSSNFRLSLPQPNANQNSAIKGEVTQEDSSRNLTQIQLQKLAAHDIILVTDKSGSMATPDCPLNAHSGSGLKNLLPSLMMGGSFQNSRWQWCRQQITDMANQTQQILPAGFTVLLFDSGYYLFPHVNENSLARIFATNGPGGSTNLALPLSKIFDDYFKRQKLSRVKIKPLLIGIITDGCPDSPTEVRRLLLDLTRRMQDPNEISIVFFLIGGHDPEGEKFVSTLSQKLLQSGASFNIVKAVPFDEVQRNGLARSLADNLNF